MDETGRAAPISDAARGIQSPAPSSAGGREGGTSGPIAWKMPASITPADRGLVPPVPDGRTGPMSRVDNGDDARRGGPASWTGTRMSPLDDLLSAQDPNVVKLVRTRPELLDKIDKGNKSILDRLLQIKYMPVIPGAPYDVLRTAVRMVGMLLGILYKPDDKIGQGDTNGCMAALIEYVFATQAPEAFVRFMSALILGDVRYLSDLGITKTASASGPGAFGRTYIDQLFQATLQEHTIPSYSNKSARVVMGVNVSDFNDVLTGMDISSFKSAMYFIFGVPEKAITDNRTSLTLGIGKSTAGMRLPCLMGVDWVKPTVDGGYETTGHAILIEKFDGADAIFFDLADLSSSGSLPVGTVVDGKIKLSSHQGPKRMVAANGRWRIPIVELDKIAEYWGPTNGYVGPAGGY